MRNGRVETKDINPRDVCRDLETTMQFISGTAQSKAMVLSTGPWRWIKHLGEKEREERKVKDGSEDPVPKN